MTVTVIVAVTVTVTVIGTVTAIAGTTVLSEGRCSDDLERVKVACDGATRSQPRRHWAPTLEIHPSST
jgi:hypothetical protein